MNNRRNSGFDIEEFREESAPSTVKASDVFTKPTIRNPDLDKYIKKTSGPNGDNRTNQPLSLDFSDLDRVFEQAAETLPARRVEIISALQRQITANEQSIDSPANQEALRDCRRTVNEMLIRSRRQVPTIPPPTVHSAGISQETGNKSKE